MGVVLQEFIERMWILGDATSETITNGSQISWCGLGCWNMLKHIFEWLKGVKVDNGCNEFDSVEWLNEIDSVDPVKKG